MSAGRRLHVVGAGVAGLSAALTALDAGAEVALYEAAPQPGGRCRTIVPATGFRYDNGTHALVGANPRALALLSRVGARERWIEPEPEGLPVYDARDGSLARVALSPAGWWRQDRRPPGLGLADLPRLARLALPLADRPIGPLFAGRPLLEGFVEPLTVAVLNTPVAIASSAKLGRALRRVVRPGGARLYVARTGLGPDLVEPAFAALTAGGAVARTGARLKAIETRAGRVSALVFGEARIAVGEGEGVVLALPPAEIARLMPGLDVPDAYEPILNVHIGLAAGPATPRFVGLVGTLSQWVLVREDHLSVTVSAAGEAQTGDPEALVARILGEIAPAMAAAGVATGEHGEARVVKEKRATIRQAAGAAPVRARPSVGGLALAGDWLSPLPATIEAAIASGEAAAQALLRDLPARSRTPLPALDAAERAP